MKFLVELLTKQHSILAEKETNKLVKELEYLAKNISTCPGYSRKFRKFQRDIDRLARR